jgi:PAS domain S-box-containing protein
MWIAFGVPTALLFATVLILGICVGRVEAQTLALRDAARDAVALRGLLGILTVTTILVGAGAVVALLVGWSVGAGLRRTERELWSSRERLRATLASIGDAVITTDAGGRPTYLNPVAEALTGWSSGETVGPTLATVFPAIDAQTRLMVAASRPAHTDRQARPGRREDVLVRRDGTERRTDGTLRSILDDRGRAVGIVVVFHDVTEPRRTEAALLRSERALVAALRVAARRHQEFLAELAHELRTPLAAIHNALELMQRASGDAGKLLLARDTIGRQTRHLGRLVGDLFDLQRIAHGKLTLRKERVDLAAIVGDAIELARPGVDAGAHELTVTLPTQPVHLHADGMRLVQVLSNLLGNACKYSPPRSPISLRVERHQSEAEISVTDAGIGIPPHLLRRIFNLFVQVDRPSRGAQGGLGIGLMLVRRFVTLHGGTVAARSDGPGRGSTFVVRLPILTAASAPFASARATRPAGLLRGNRRVLVVDDDRDAATTLAMILHTAGHATQVVHDGREATAAAATFRPDVVLLDLGLPDMDGREAAGRIRQLPGGERMMVVAVTGQERAAAFGPFETTVFDHHLVKPVDVQQLLGLLAELSEAESNST